jgi:hypothetical protein
MRILLGWMLIVLTATPAFSQGSSDWNAVTTLASTSLVRVTGTRAGLRQRLVGRFVSADDTRVTITTNTKQDLVFFDRAKVQRVELVIGEPLARQKSIMKGLGYGAIFALIGTVNGILGGFQEGGEIAVAALYAVTLGGGAGYGALKSKGKGAQYVRIYERP